MLEERLEGDEGASCVAMEGTAFWQREKPLRGSSGRRGPSEVQGQKTVDVAGIE